ncbi:MAG: GNAT family N-acetyltransferase [Robiginitomaculum sp.]|nr:MAG: GNAT family N-acetyltransferase [Robiginitomaculum sp.]
METQLETERLILRNINADTDFSPWAEMMADAQTIAYLWNNTPYNAEAAWQNMVMNIGHWQARGYGFFSVIDKRSGEWVGRVGPYNPHGWPEPEIGWAVHPNHTRKGYGYEAAKACIDYVFDTLGWERLTHVIVEENIPSIKLAEKLGSRFLYKIDDCKHGRTRLVYGQTKE